MKNQLRKIIMVVMCLCILSVTNVMACHGNGLFGIRGRMQERRSNRQLSFETKSTVYVEEEFHLREVRVFRGLKSVCGLFGCH